MTLCAVILHTGRTRRRANTRKSTRLKTRRGRSSRSAGMGMINLSFYRQDLSLNCSRHVSRDLLRRLFWKHVTLHARSLTAPMPPFCSPQARETTPLYRSQPQTLSQDVQTGSKFCGQCPEHFGAQKRVRIVSSLPAPWLESTEIRADGMYSRR